MSLPGQYEQFLSSLRNLIPEKRIYTDPTRTLAYGTDASFYRLVPKIVVKVMDRNEISLVMRQADALGIPLCFRAAGTSLCGQAITDSVLVVLAGGWGKHAVLDGGSKIKLEPGIIGSEANAYLRNYGKKIGPDPASINCAMIGGIAANNASGMCCGTSDNSYKTLDSMTLIFRDGTVLDTGDAASRNAFLVSNAPLVAEVERIRDEIMADAALVERIRHKFKIKNTTGYGINAFVDHHDPIDIIAHLMIGSEGTLAFIADITYRTVVEEAHKASALIIFPDIETTCRAVMRLYRPLVSAAEMIDRIGMRSVEDKAGIPPYIKTLDDKACALLVEVRGDSKDELQGKIEKVGEVLADINTVRPIEFTAVKAEYEAYWNIRKGVFPAVGNIRKIGTTVIIEDVAYPLERLAEATLELRIIMDEFGYCDGIIYGHALDGNLHFVFTQDFNDPCEVDRYRRFMERIVKSVVEEFDGALKAEHGTGRNMAPFVEVEWGKQAYDFMVRIKKLFDPQNILNPDVIICDDPEIFVKNFKAMTPADEIIDKCIECGFCEPMCPSRYLTATPRQRITTQREIARLKKTGEDPQRLRSLEEGYEYFGNETCATDGLCATVCPVSINTGDHIKGYRGKRLTPGAHKVAKWITGNFSTVTKVARVAMGGAGLAQSILGNRVMGVLAGAARNIGGHKVPQWNPWMPGAGETPDGTHLPKGSDPDRRVVYFPSCVSRMMGCSKGDKDHRPLNRVLLSILDKAGYTVILPPNLEDLCCGMPFESQGFAAEADGMSAQLEQVLLQVTENGAIPVLSDTSPCICRMKRVMDKRLKLYEPVEFIHDLLLDKLEFQRVPDTIAVHVTCSSIKMGIGEKFRKVAEACAERVVLPENVKCCGFAGDKGFEVPELNEVALAGLKEALPPDTAEGYSNSRTCEIGLSNTSGLSYQSIAYLVDRCSRAKK